MSVQPPFEADSDTSRKRNSAKALVVRDGRILLTVNGDPDGDFYLLPGGGQRLGETLHETVIREVLEETGWLVKPGELLLVRDYVGANHEFASEEGDVHQTEFVFGSEPLEKIEEPTCVDAWQTGVEWVTPERLQDIRIYPSVLSRIIPMILCGAYSGPVYLGDVN